MQVDVLEKVFHRHSAQGLEEAEEIAVDLNGCRYAFVFNKVEISEEGFEIVKGDEVVL